MYKEDSQTFISQNPVTEYLKKAQEWLAEEELRVKNCLHPSTLKPLVSLTEAILLTNHATIIQDQFQPLLERGKLQDLERMYSLLARVPDTLGILRDYFEGHVKEKGLEAAKQITAISAQPPPEESPVPERRGSGTTSRPSSGPAEIDPKVYCDALLQVYNTYSTICGTTFKGESGFVASLDKACREFVNRNVLCPSGSSKSAELLAKYVDALLRKGIKMNEEDEMDKLLNGIVNLLLYVFLASDTYLDDHFQVFRRQGRLSKVLL